MITIKRDDGSDDRFRVFDGDQPIALLIPEDSEDGQRIELTLYAITNCVSVCHISNDPPELGVTVSVLKEL